MGARCSFQYREHWFSFAESCVLVREFGTGGGNAALFFLHGRFGQSEIWSPLIEALAPNFRCFCLDLPGFGRSYSVRERGLSLLEHAELACRVVKRFSGSVKAVLAGHDFGAGVAELCAIHDPAAVSSLVLVNACSITHPLPSFFPGWKGLMGRWRLRRLVEKANLANSEKRAFRDLFEEPWRFSESRASIVAALRALQETWPGPFEREAWKDEISRLPHPALLLHGAMEPLGSMPIAMELMRYFSEAYFFQTEKAGLWPCLEDPAWAIAKTREFLFRVESRRLSA